MNASLMAALSREEQERFFSEVYDLLALQVQRYHKHYHMGENTSVPEETAKELMESLLYTLGKIDFSGQSLAAALERGQEVLKRQTGESEKLLKLVAVTAPEVCSDSYHDTLDALGRWLRRYDCLHFAHCRPAFLEYPLLFDGWEDMRGIDCVQCYLKGMWQENQILEAFETEYLDELYSCLGPDFGSIPINLCEQPLVNAIGSRLLGRQAGLLDEADRQKLVNVLTNADDLKGLMTKALKALCDERKLSGIDAAGYAQIVISRLLPRLEAGLTAGSLDGIFLG